MTNDSDNTRAYANSYWLQHTIQSTPDEELFQDLIQTVQSIDDLSQIMIIIDWLKVRPHLNDRLTLLTHFQALENQAGLPGVVLGCEERLECLKKGRK